MILLLKFTDLAYHYWLDKSTVIFAGIRDDFEIVFYFSMKILQANIRASDGTQRSAALYMELNYCLCPA